MRICLIGVTHVSHNPRLLREADSLSAAGHEVRVVAPSFTVRLAESDRRQLSSRQWQHDSVDYLPVGMSGKARSIFMRGRRRTAFQLQQMFGGTRLAEYAYTTAFPELRRQASSEPADWFIAHAHPALPIAAAAARRCNARLGFDCEDLLTEHGIGPADIPRSLEEAYLESCDYVSVPSQGIADRLQRDYSINPPIVLYNVFPLSLARDMTAPADRAERATVKCHWFSQTIGPGRGIEEAIEGCGMLGEGIELHLRGNPSGGYEEVVRSLAARRQVKLELHPQVDHDDLIRAMGQFDVGLALERGEHGNYSLTVTNKIGSYLLAGLAIAATDTQGQREVLEQIPAAGFLYPSGKPELLAAGLRKWIENRKALRDAQQAAWDSAGQLFCWDIQQQKFFNALGIPDATARGAATTDRAYS